MSVTYTLVRECLNNVEDAGIRWQIEGGNVLQKDKQVGTYSSVKRVRCGTAKFNTAQLWLTLFFPPKKAGAPENMTLHGSHDFNSGNEIGSVSAASSAFSGNIAKQFNRVVNTLTIG
jgi:hypothetical protein